MQFQRLPVSGTLSLTVVAGSMASLIVAPALPDEVFVQICMTIILGLPLCLFVDRRRAIHHQRTAGYRAPDLGCPLLPGNHSARPNSTRGNIGPVDGPEPEQSFGAGQSAKPPSDSCGVEFQFALPGRSEN